MTETTENQVRLRACLARVVGNQADNIDVEAPLREALTGFDSLAAAEYIVAVEQEFDVEVDFVLHDVRFRMASLASGARFVEELLEDGQVLSS